MGVYSVKGKGWRYDFQGQGNRYTKSGFKTKKEAKQAEAEMRKELKNPALILNSPTDITFWELVQLRLDHVKAYNSASHYRDVLYHCRRWAKKWKNFKFSEITTRIIESYLKGRVEVSAYVANKDLQYLRALFNYGINKKLLLTNPTDGIIFFPIEKRKKYVPPKEDVLKAISTANPEAQQYLWTIVLTAARVGEINALTWDDVDFDKRLVTLWTRKRKGGNREHREVPMIPKLYDILLFRFKNRKGDRPWVFWHTYWDRSKGTWIQGPYGDRKILMASLCQKAGVKYFRYHALRHLSASFLDDNGVAIGLIQRILGHQNRRTTEIYLHSVGEAEREAMLKLEGIQLFQPPPVSEPKKHTNMPMAFWNRKVERPSYQSLLYDTKQLGYLATGRKYGVSDNAVRKWIKSYEADLEQQG